MTQARDRYGRIKKKCRCVPVQRRCVRHTKGETMTEEERVRKEIRLREELQRMDDAWLVHQRRERRQMVLILSLIAGAICLLVLLEVYS